jgi:hypothetical protein
MLVRIRATACDCSSPAPAFSTVQNGTLRVVLRPRKLVWAASVPHRKEFVYPKRISLGVNESKPNIVAVGFLEPTTHELKKAWGTRDGTHEFKNRPVGSIHTMFSTPARNAGAQQLHAYRALISINKSVLNAYSFVSWVSD